MLTLSPWPCPVAFPSAVGGMMPPKKYVHVLTTPTGTCEWDLVRKWVFADVTKMRSHWLREAASPLTVPYKRRPWSRRQVTTEVPGSGCVPAPAWIQKRDVLCSSQIFLINFDSKILQ